MKRTILITGGAGFVGSSLADRLVKDSDNFVVLVDDISTGSKEKLPSREFTNWKFIKCDVNNYADISAIMFSHHFDYVFHYAAVVGVQRTLDNPTYVLKDIDGIKNILDLSKNTGVERVFYSSSSEVYGESMDYPQDEIHTPLNSRLPYAVVKNVGEAFCTSYKQEFDLDYTIFRFFNTYGPKQSNDFVMSRFLEAAMRGEDITVHGKGHQSRTFCYVEDNITATTACLYDNHFLNDVVNIGSSVETSILELAETIIRLTGSSSKIVHIPAREEGDMPRRCPNTDRMQTLLQKAPIPLEEGIKRLIVSGKFG